MWKNGRIEKWELGKWEALIRVTCDRELGRAMVVHIKNGHGKWKNRKLPFKLFTLNSRSISRSNPKVLRHQVSASWHLGKKKRGKKFPYGLAYISHVLFFRETRIKYSKGFLLKKNKSLSIFSSPNFFLTYLPWRIL